VKDHAERLINLFLFPSFLVPISAHEKTIHTDAVGYAAVLVPKISRSKNVAIIAELSRAVRRTYCN